MRSRFDPDLKRSMGNLAVHGVEHLQCQAGDGYHGEPDHGLTTSASAAVGEGGEQDLRIAEPGEDRSPS